MSSSAAAAPAFDWHPKLTPYRLGFIAISGGLGVTKAVLVSHGQVASSTTVEWIAGVVVALSFQFLGEYEYKHNRVVHMDWMFSYDCLNILKTLFGENRRTPTRAGIQADSVIIPKRPPIVTAYRMLVSTIVSVLGIAKMLSGYLGLSVAMNTFDWVVAVPLTLRLYYIGLFEDRRSSVPRILFDIEYSSKARRWLYFTGGVISCLSWLCAWFIILHIAVEFYSGAGLNTHSVWEARGERAAQWMGISFCLGMLEVGAWGLGIVLWPIIKARSGRHADSIHKYADLVATLILYLLSAMFFAALCLVGPFSAGQVLNTSDNNCLPLPFRMILAGVMFCSIAVPAALAYGFLFLAVDVFSDNIPNLLLLMILPTESLTGDAPRAAN